jgi:hypothetical protein
MIIANLDLDTLKTFQYLSRRAGELVRSLPQYNAIKRHALNALIAAKRIGTSKWTTCQALYDNVCTPNCQKCGDFGYFLYLFSCQRVCLICVLEQLEFRLLNCKQANERFGINTREFEQLQHISSIPGRYGNNATEFKGQVALVEWQTAQAAGIAIYGSLRSVHRLRSERYRLHSIKVNAIRSSAIRCGNTTRVADRKAETVREEWGSQDGLHDNPFRFAGVVHLPWFNSNRTKSVDWGFYCLACWGAPKCEKGGEFDGRRSFTSATFEEHLRRCGPIERGKHPPHRDTVRLPVLVSREDIL